MSEAPANDGTSGSLPPSEATKPTSFVSPEEFEAFRKWQASQANQSSESSASVDSLSSPSSPMSEAGGIGAAVTTPENPKKSRRPIVLAGVALLVVIAGVVGFFVWQGQQFPSFQELRTQCIESDSCSDVTTIMIISSDDQTLSIYDSGAADTDSRTRNALKIAEFVNGPLGFDENVLEDMRRTQPGVAARAVSSKGLTAEWMMHDGAGLEIAYYVDSKAAQPIAARCPITVDFTGLVEEYEDDSLVKDIESPDANSLRINVWYFGRVQEINERLGLPGSIDTRMGMTRALDGTQTAEEGPYRVSWTYHPDDGLDVLYEKICKE